MLNMPQHLSVLRKIYARLQGCKAVWVVTGSLGMALQGMEIEAHDIDLQTDRQGAYEIEGLLADFVVKPVCYRTSERIRSHYGLLEVDGIQVEIMGDLQKRLSEGSSDDPGILPAEKLSAEPQAHLPSSQVLWEEPVPVARYRQWVEIEGMRIPVFPLEYELEAYTKLGRVEKAEMIRAWLQKQQAKTGQEKF